MLKRIETAHEQKNDLGKSIHVRLWNDLAKVGESFWRHVVRITKDHPFRAFGANLPEAD